MTAPGGLASLHPAYFAMVMATGIVSIASHLLGFIAIGRALFWLNIPVYGALWVLLILRCVRYPKNVRADLSHHGRSVGFFTTIAGTCVLGSQFLIVGGAWMIAAWLWAVGIALLAILIYGIITILTVKESKPGLAEGINGGWLLPVVASQSVVVLGAQLSPFFGASQEHVLLFCLIVWLGAGMLYIWIISLIFYRYTFFTLNPSDLAPPYWINMGAVAISTLAGTMLIAGAEHSRLVRELMPFIKGMTLAFWATATWWIPMLILLGAWRHLYRRFPVTYDPLYWGAVFPLGMYTACTWRLAAVLHVSIIEPIAHTFIYIALAAWLLTFFGWVRTMAKHSLRATRRGS